MAQTLARIDWRRENQINLKVKINRNQNPELFRVLTESSNRSELVRDLLREGYEIKYGK